MKLEIGIPDYQFKAIGAIKKIEIKGFRDRHIEVIQVTMAAISDLHDRLPNVRAIPAFFGYDDLNHVLWFHPLPNSEFEIIIKDERKPVVKKEAA